MTIQWTREEILGQLSGGINVFIVVDCQKYESEKEPMNKISDGLVTKMVALFLQQLSEKIDRIRLLAGSLLQNFFDFYVYKFKIPDQELEINI